MENTIQFENITGQQTIPALCEENGAHLRKPGYHVGEQFEDYKLIALVRCTLQSELWYCVDSSEDDYILKITGHIPEEEVVMMIQDIECDNLVPLIDYGRSGGNWYEVYPYYREGSISGRIDQETVRNVILPGIMAGLNALHENKIVHNDIKPSNIFWGENRKKVLIGDFGSAAAVKSKPVQFTPSFAAPELLNNDISRRASDWCSVGLTIAAIIEGSPLIEANTVQQARRAWERGVHFRGNEDIDQNLKLLINGMINMEMTKRAGPKAAAKWCEGGIFSGETRTKTAREKNRPGSVTISFHEPELIAADIEGLIRGITDHWEYSLFLFRQGKMDRFLGQFNKVLGKELILTCRELRKLVNDEDAVYRLTLEIDQNQSFVWRGKRYYSLTEMEETFKSGDQGRNDIVVFLQRGNVTYYLEKDGRDREQIAFAERLRSASRIHPYEACAQLFQSLKGNDGLFWDGFTLKNLDDLVDWLDYRKGDMDRAVEEVFGSSEFEAWLAYQGMGDVLEDIRRKCEV